MHARSVSAGDGSAESSGPNTAQSDVRRRQIENLEASIKRHQEAHAYRIGTLNAQSDAFIRLLAEEIRLIQEAEERQRSGQATHGQVEGDAAPLMA